MLIVFPSQLICIFTKFCLSFNKGFRDTRERLLPPSVSAKNFLISLHSCLNYLHYRFVDVVLGRREECRAVLRQRK